MSVIPLIALLVSYVQFCSSADVLARIDVVVVAFIQPNCKAFVTRIFDFVADGQFYVQRVSNMLSFIVI